MTGSLGELGTVRGEIDATFGYFGLTIRVHPDASNLDLVDFMMEAETIEEIDETRAMLSLCKYLKGLVHPDDWESFWRASKGNRQTLKDMMLTAHDIMEAVSGVPTGRPSASSNGRPNTPRRSKAASQPRRTGRGTGRPRAIEQDTTRALTLLSGRPDLQSAVVRAHEARQAAAG